MKMKFFADDFNARFLWAWKDGQHITEDNAEIEHLKGLGLRCEKVEEEVKKEVKKPARTRKPK